MKLLFTVAFASLAVTATALAIPEPPNLPTDVTNMIGGQKWLENVLKQRPFHILRRREDDTNAGSEPCQRKRIGTSTRL